MSRINTNFESALEKIARTMTRNFEGIQVVIQGNTAKTDGHTIWLPMLEDVSEELYDDLNGFLDHEVAHCKFTEFPEIRRCLNRFHREMLNAVEDSRIEILLPMEYPGTEANLSRLNAKWGAKVAEKRKTLPWPIRLILAIRATYDGRKIEIDEDFEPLYLRIEEQAKALNKLRGTKLLRTATEKMVHDINDERRKLAAHLPDPEEDEDGEPQEGETPIGLKDPKDKKNKKKKVATQNEQIDPSVEERDATEGEEGDDEEGGEEGEGETGEDEDSDEDSDSGKGKGKGNEKEGDGESDDKGGESGGGNDEEGENDESGKGGDDGETSDKSGKAGDKGKPRKGGDDKNDEKPAKHKLETRRNYAKWVETDKEKKMMEEPDEAADSEYDKHIMSPESYMESKINAEIKSQPQIRNRRGYYSGRSKIEEAVSLPISREFDEVTDYTGKGNHDEYGRKKKTVMPLINPIKQHLERVLKVKENARYRFNRERGAINARALAQVVASDAFRTPFKEFGKTDTTNVAVELLIDQSGSMSGEKIEVARQTALAIGESLLALGIAFEVTGFYTDDDRKLAAMAAKLTTEESARFNRFGTKLKLQVFKNFDSPNLNGITECHSAGCNCDGESVLWAAKRLALRKEKRKILLVFSDGQPSYSGADHEALGGDLRRVVRLLPKAGIEVVGFGIQTDDVKLFYPEYVVVNDVSKLPTTVMSKVSKILERGFKN